MKTIVAASFLLAVIAGVARGDCDDLKAITFPLTQDTTVTLTDASAPCDNLESGLPPEFVIEGGILTLTGAAEAAFANLRFAVMDNAGLIFDFEETQFGPNFDYPGEDNYRGYMLHVAEGAYAEFSGKMVATGADNYYSVFLNEGTLEFKDDAHFHDCETNIFRENLGELKFFGDAIFERNTLLGIWNNGGSVWFAGDAFFDDLGVFFDEPNGACFQNQHDGIAIFEGAAVFQNTRSFHGGAFYNTASTTFKGEARFYDNRAYGEGGAVYNSGTMTFAGAVEMTGNQASTGGALLVKDGGSVSFDRQVTIQRNSATETGGAMSILDDGSIGSSVEFRKPKEVTISGNLQTGPESGCNNIYLEENSELIGYESDDGDICDES